MQDCKDGEWAEALQCEETGVLGCSSLEEAPGILSCSLPSRESIRRTGCSDRLDQETFWGNVGSLFTMRSQGLAQHTQEMLYISMLGGFWDWAASKLWRTWSDLTPAQDQASGSSEEYFVHLIRYKEKNFIKTEEAEKANIVLFQSRQNFAKPQWNVWTESGNDHCTCCALTVLSC